MRARRRDVDGVLLLDKPPDITSNTALMRVKHLYGAAKAGHTGTLDPLATGVLPICFGEATKFARFLLEAGKRYVAAVHFGVTTTTEDAEGAVLEMRPVTLDRGAIEAALPAFTGCIRQVPPAYSALKYQGRSHYDYARRGIDVPRHPRDVEIASLSLVDWSPPLATLDVECGKGTYIRTLAADLGAALGCGAHLARLRRTAAGAFGIEDANTFESLEHVSVEERDRLLLPVDALLAGLPRIDVDAVEASRLRQGQALRGERHPDQFLRAYGPSGELLGVVRAADEYLAPVRMTSTRMPAHVR